MELLLAFTAFFSLLISLLIFSYILAIGFDSIKTRSIAIIFDIIFFTITGFCFYQIQDYKRSERDKVERLHSLEVCKENKNCYFREVLQSCYKTESGANCKDITTHIKQFECKDINNEKIIGKDKTWNIY